MENEKHSVKGRDLPFMTDKDYFNQRLQEQIEYHDVRAKNNQYKYKLYKRIEFILAASIPVVISLSAMGVFENIVLFNFTKTIEGKEIIISTFNLTILLQILAALAGVFLAFINKVLELDEYFKLWKDYRYIHERLIQERILYLTHTDPYNSENAFSDFVDNIESILSNQVQKWRQMQKPQNQEHVKKALAAVDSIGKQSDIKSTDNNQLNSSDDTIDSSGEENTFDENRKKSQNDISTESDNEKEDEVFG